MMANLRRGEVDVELCGQSYCLAFDFNSIAEIEEKFGDRPFNELIKTQSGMLPIRFVREALRVGLERYSGKKTPKEVGRLLGEAIQADPDALLKIIKAIMAGIGGAFGSGEEKKKESSDSPVPRSALATGEG